MGQEYQKLSRILDTPYNIPREVLLSLFANRALHLCSVQAIICKFSPPPFPFIISPYNTRNVLCCLISTFRVGEMGRTRVEKHAHWRFIFNLPTRYLPDTKVSGSRFRTLQLFSYRYNVKCDDIPSSRSKAFVSTNENQPRFRYPGDYSLTVASSLISAVNTEQFRYYTHTHTHCVLINRWQRDISYRPMDTEAHRRNRIVLRNQPSRDIERKVSTELSPTHL